MKKVVVIGDVIEDIIVISNTERKANTDNPSTIKSTPGGSGANFAVWLATQGIEVDLYSRVSSRDRQKLEDYFRLRGVSAEFQFDNNLDTGRIVVLVEGNQRTFFTDRGANRGFMLNSAPLCDLLYLSGYSVVTLGALQTQLLISQAKQRGSLVAVDPGSTSYIANFGVVEFLDAINGADMIFPNEEEHTLLLHGSKQLTQFSEVAVTKGKDGAELQGILHVDALDVDVIDPTGAGDAFAAKYIASRLGGSSPSEALLEATHFAAKAVAQPGGQPRV